VERDDGAENANALDTEGHERRGHLDLDEGSQPQCGEERWM
jgi:hypothetical protein